MTYDQGDRPRLLGHRRPSGDYEVGYAKPPVHSRFQPGQSGNPRGRPKGSRKQGAASSTIEGRLEGIILAEAYRQITINDVKGPLTIPMAQAVIRSVAVNAAKGSQRAQRLFTELVGAIEQDHRRLREELLQAAISYKADWEIELERRARLGITGPEPIPHPDHVVLDLTTGMVRIQGPLTKEQKASWDKLRQRKADCDTAIAANQAELRRRPNHPHKQFLLDDIKHEKKIKSIITKAIPD